VREANHPPKNGTKAKRKESFSVDIFFLFHIEIHSPTRGVGAITKGKNIFNRMLLRDKNETFPECLQNGFIKNSASV
jgi:hypothetical protein